VTKTMCRALSWTGTKAAGWSGFGTVDLHWMTEFSTFGEFEPFVHQISISNNTILYSTIAY
jgi:hypothetical protein